jgi:type I restriction enzyme S subunit
VPFISVKDITTGTLKFDDCKFVSEGDFNAFTRRCKPEFMDILYTKVGATYGRPALVDVTRPFCLYVSVALIKPNRAIVDPLFLKELLASPVVKNQADRAVKGAGVPDLHLVEIKSFKVPLPPMQVQKTFVEKTNSLRRAIEHRKQGLQLGMRLSESLAQRAFRGEL